MDKEISNNNRRIAKNTLLLYLRMFITMCIGIYTSRIILKNLGVVDFGIYNVVSGMVTMFTFLNTTLATSTQRFITFSLGRESLIERIKTFSTAFWIHLYLSIIMMIIILIMGLWFMDGHLNIPNERMSAAYWVFGCSLIIIMMSITQVPYTSSIIAHEDMKVYAYMSIYEALSKLVVAIGITVISYDQLIIYSLLIMLTRLVNLGLYRYYCQKHYKECSLTRVIDKPLLKSMLSFSGWNVFGCMAFMLNNQGFNILINIIFGPIMNTAREIANLLNSYVLQLVNNFLTASNPQIVKYHACGDKESMVKLINNSAKYAGILMAVMLLPLYFEIDYILKIWLGETPKETVFFTRIVLVQSLIQTMSRSIVMGIHATGKMKLPSILSSSILLLILPISWGLLKIGVGLPIVLSINLLPWVFETGVLAYLLYKYVNFSIFQYLKEVYCVVLFIMIIMIVPLYCINVSLNEGLFRLLSSCICSVIVSFILIYRFVLSKELKVMVRERIINMLTQKH